MAVLISLGGKSGGDGFLVAPVGSTYDSELSLATDAGTLAVTLQASPNAAGLVFSQTNLTLSTTPTIVTVHPTLQSTAREDTRIRVLDGAMMEVASFTVTAIKKLKVNFRGRFEVRFATDGARYNVNPMYTDVIDQVVPPGWTWALEGEPEFVPAVGNVPESLETPVGRVLRFNNPVALRAPAPAVVSTVTSITGETTTSTETFTAGDPVIGQPVDVGPNTYLASNWPFNAPAPEEFVDTFNNPPTERMALFEFHIGNMFSGASQIGPFVAKATVSGQQTRTPDSRPKSAGLVIANNDLAGFGLPNGATGITTWSETRINALVVDYNNLPPGPSPERRNLARRIGHLLGHLFFVGSQTATDVQNANPGQFIQRARTLSGGWNNKEVYTGLVDTNLAFSSAGSSVVAYLSEFQSFKFECHMFGFHSDELCGYHTGTLNPHQLVNGAYVGDPHTRTVNGTHYDFQAVGEFTLLRDGSRMVVQVRQSPVATQHPITDSYTGLTACVSVNTAVAARLGKHQVSLQPEREGRRLQFYLDGKRADLSPDGIDLDGHRVASFDANGETGMRVDFEDESVLVVTPAFWTAHNVWYLNVNISNTSANEGIMGLIPRNAWLPRLRDGQSVGPKPASLQDRYVTLYQKFADSWRVTSQTSLFVYAPGTSTDTFTDRDWPAEKAPCTVKPEFQVPGVPVFNGMPIDKAAQVCKAVTIKDLHRNCVFDVATTGDEIFAKGYLFEQELRLSSTAVQLTVYEAADRQERAPDDKADRAAAANRAGHAVFLTATVLALNPGGPVPTGTVTFYIDGKAATRAVKLDQQGSARVTAGPLEPGDHKISATYSGARRPKYHASSSRTHLYRVEPRTDANR